MENSLSNYQLSTGINNLKQLSTVQLSVVEVDTIYKDISDLTNETFKSWYCGRIYQLGRQEIMKRASIARADGKEPKKLFSTLIKGN